MRRRARGTGSIFYDANRRRWTAQITVGYCPADGRRVRRTRHAKTQRDAIAALRALETEVTSSSAITGANPDKIYITDYIRGYINLSGRQLRENTQKALDGSLNRLKKYAGAVKLSACNTPTIQTIINQMSGDGYAAGTIRIDLSLLLRALRYAFDDGLIKRLPALSRLKYPPRTETKKHYVPDDTFYKMLRKCENRLNGCLYLIALVARYCGLRRGEIAAMTWNNFDAKQGIYNVRNQLSDKLKLEPLKTASSRRFIPLPSGLLQLLLDHRKRQLKLSMRYGVRTDFIFCRDDGSPFAPSLISNHFKEVCSFSPHDLRHTYASDMATRVDIKTLQSLLGHATANMSLNVYAESIDKNIVNARCPMSII